MKRVVSVILGGGKGTRLFPLTMHRSKPAVPIGGKYRLIDIPVSNCVNDHLRHIFVLTQYNSESLNRHVAQTYRFDRFNNGFVSILAAEQTYDNRDWFQGTADAVRKSLRHIMGLNPGLVLILSGDQLYRMDFNRFIEHHRETGAEITIATKPVDASEATSMGIMKVSEEGRIGHFHEKPDPHQLEPLKSSQEGLTEEKPYLGSMGIYLFSPDVLRGVLDANPAHTDFGHEIIPYAIGNHRVFSYPFDGYWSDIGTIASFFDANLDMASENPSFDMYRNFSPLYTRARALPGARIDNCHIRSSVICDASDLQGAEVERCIVGLRGRIRAGSVLRNCVYMGADYWEGHFRDPGLQNPDLPRLGIGHDCLVEGAIIDKNARIGDGVRIHNSQGKTEDEGEGYHIRDGIVVVHKNAVIPDGAEI